MRIFGWPADNAGCCYYRMRLPLHALAARGHEVAVDAVMPDEWRHTADIIVGQRVCQPGATVRWQALAREDRARLVFEVDDDLFDVHPSSKAAHAWFSQPGVQANLELNIRAAHLVTVTTDHLAERLSHLNPNVVVLPNCVPEALLDLPTVPDAEHLTVGWSGSPTHEVDWRGPAEDIARVISRRPDLTMHLIGGWTPEVLWNRLPRDRRRLTGWIHDVDALHRALDFHIGVIPLRDIGFNRSKSAVKLLELAARAIPAVMSNGGPYAAAARDGAPALLVDRPADWARHLHALADDPDLRIQLGKQARDWAAGQTIEANAHRWAAAYEGIM